MTEKSESIATLVAAVLNTMAVIKGIEKNLSVGDGNNSYKGVADQDVKKTVGDAMEQNGLTIFPIGIEETTSVESWMEKTNYGEKRKQSVFTKVVTKYLLAHESGEWIQLVGFGHGVDSQDKSAGKATTYALKYALLYTFMVPTGKIDDADNTHSDDIPPVGQRNTQAPPPPPPPPPPPVQLTLKEAVAEMMGTVTLEGVKKVWLRHKAHQANPEFATAKESMKIKLTPIPAQ